METPDSETLSLPLPAILALEFDCGDLNQPMTIRNYLLTLLATLWEEEEGFSGKRPFGNSGWKHDVHRALVTAGVVTGTLDRDGWLDTCDDKAADAVIQACIAHMGVTP
jgi:hypothetical protein